MTISEMTNIVHNIYGIQDDRLYEMEDLFYYQQKFLIRFLSARKAKNQDKAIQNLTIVLAWFLALAARFHLDLDKSLYHRYSYKCPFCLSLPCACEEGEKKPMKTGRPTSVRPETITEWQKVIKKIYPADRKLNHELRTALDEMHFAFRRFRRDLGRSMVKDLEVSAVDFFVIILRQYNIFEIDLAKTFSKFLKDGCFACKKTPCECYFTE